MSLLRLFFSELSQPVVFVLYVSVSLKPLLLSAFEYDMSDVRFAIDIGICFRTTGTW